MGRFVDIYIHVSFIYSQKFDFEEMLKFKNLI